MAWATRSIARATRSQVEGAHRPVIVPASSTAELAFRIGRVTDASAGPAMHGPKLVVPVENVGMGPALNVRGECAALVGGSTFGTGVVAHPVEGVAAGSANAVTFAPREGDLKDHPELALRLSYEDVAGRSYWTALHFTQREQGYTCRLGDGALPDSMRLLAASS
jgi:hypothetical protein